MWVQKKLYLRAVIKFFFLQGKPLKEIQTILTEILREHALWFATLKKLVAQYKCDDFSTCDASRPGRPTTENVDQIHEIILKDRWIFLKSIAEQLNISRERVWHHSWRSGRAEDLREMCHKMPERGSETSMVPVVWANWNYFGAIEKISCCDW